MQFHVRAMSKEDAHLIASWHYEAPYDFYDMDRDQGDLAELLNPDSWKESYFSVHNERDELIGFFAYKRENEKTVEIGLGLRPDLTGKGLGRAFVHAGGAFAKTHYSVTQLSLYVATFNQRAIRLYEQAGFVPLDTNMRRTNGGEYEFLRMIQQMP
ncbi:MAG TPA: GNAT family N-acetyltransferase [Ktedonobacter sp.]|nr:GNAT family N-acetyltransferase [Ktedonobacter sp.]